MAEPGKILLPTQRLTTYILIDLAFTAFGNFTSARLVSLKGREKYDNCCRAREKPVLINSRQTDRESERQELGRQAGSVAEAVIKVV